MRKWEHWMRRYSVLRRINEQTVFGRMAVVAERAAAGAITEDEARDKLYRLSDSALAVAIKCGELAKRDARREVLRSIGGMGPIK